MNKKNFNNAVLLVLSFFIATPVQSQVRQAVRLKDLSYQSDPSYVYEPIQGGGRDVPLGLELLTAIARIGRDANFRVGSIQKVVFRLASTQQKTPFRELRLQYGLAEDGHAPSIQSTVRLSIYLDGRLAGRSDVIYAEKKKHQMNVDVRGAKNLAIVLECIEPGLAPFAGNSKGDKCGYLSIFDDTLR